MQVRKSLQNPKSQRFKSNKIQTLTLNLKEKKKNKTLKTQRSKSRSKQNKEKENIKTKKAHSKSKQKVSPIKIKKVAVLNTSPVLYTQRKQKTPAKKDNEYNKIINSHRAYEPKNHLISTKLNTQRTPIKKSTQQHIKTKSSTNKKAKKSSKQQHKNTKKSKIKIQQNKCQPSPQSQQRGFKKIRKFIPQINTTGPQRKQSYFDQQIIEKLNLDKADYLRRKKNQVYKQNDNQTQRNHLPQTPIKNNYSASLSYRQYGTETEEIALFNPINVRDLQSFRKQQQLKWRIMYLQLSQLKHSRTPQKIQQILQDTHKNIQQFQYKSKQIVYSSVKSNYIIESPTKIRKALLRQRKSSQQNKSLVKTLSDQKLLQELQILDNFQDKQKKQSQQKPSGSFCLQLQKQLQSSQQALCSNTNLPFPTNIQIHHIPQLQFQKSIQVCKSIQQHLMYEFCANLVQQDRLLHSLLLKIRQQHQTKQQLQYYRINCNELYSVDLVYRLFRFICQHRMQDRIIDRINIPFGNQPIVNLRWLRNYVNAQNQQEIFEDDDQGIEPIIDNQVLSQFQAVGMIQPIQGQYFYHHCVYSSLNQLLDSMRPYGTAGLPPLQKQAKKIHKKIQNIQYQVLIQLKQILAVKMGRMQFNQQHTDPIRLAQQSYQLMDRFLIRQEEQKWKKVQDNIFQQKYFLAQSIIDLIFNQEIMIIYNEF